MSSQAAQTRRAPKEDRSLGASPKPKGARARQLKLLLLALLAAISSLLIARAGPLRQLELKLTDLRTVLLRPRAVPADIILVLADDRAEKALPEPRIFWQRYFASVLRAAEAAGARAVGFDMWLPISVRHWEPEGEAELARSVDNLRIPAVLAWENLDGAMPDVPLYIVASLRGAVGFANLTLDPDGFVRRQQLLSRDASKAPSFATLLAARLLSAEPNIDQKARLVRFGSRAVPVDSSGAMVIRYQGPAGTFPSVSMADVLAAADANEQATLRKWFSGKVVLIGTTEASDTQPTPFFRSNSFRWGMPGVEIQANTLETILQGRFLQDAPPWASPVLVALACALAALYIFGRPLGSALLLLAGVNGACLLLAVAAHAGGWLLPVVPAAMGTFFAGLASYSLYAATEGQRRRAVEDLFGKYVSPEVLGEVLSEGELQLGGSQKDISVLFSDLRNYTAYCRARDPQTVVDELNEYFSEMTAEIKRHGGMVNKFIGDGIMAVFGAPAAQPDHAARAVRCAIRMVELNGAYNLRRQQLGLQPLVIGIGIHSGPAIVGTIGASDKLEYTAIGDTVNTAARIESENKTFHSQLLVSEQTYVAAGVDPHWHAERAGCVTMKGLDPMDLYKVVSRMEGGQ